MRFRDTGLFRVDQDQEIRHGITACGVGERVVGMSVFVRPDSDVRRAGAEVIHRKHRLFQLVVVQLERAVFIAVAGLGVTEIIIVVGRSGDLAEFWVP